MLIKPKIVGQYNKFQKFEISWVKLQHAKSRAYKMFGSQIVNLTKSPMFRS